MTELVTDYLEGRMRLRDRVRFQMHVGMCRHCREYLRQVRLVAASLGRLPPGETAPMPAEVEAELLARFRDWKTGGGG
jgi:predicted anti-sigma-YlaC factor YlaD